MKYVYTYSMFDGYLTINEKEGSITQISFQKVQVTKKEIDFESSLENETSLIKEAKLQIDQYMKGKRQDFDLPIKLKGTPFQVLVWETLRTIPYGTTISYQQLAHKIGREKAQRAVGGANNKNPILFVVPCHRIIGKNGSLVGYTAGLELKKYLLELEQKVELKQ